MKTNEKGGVKADEAKPDWSLLDLSLVEDMVKVLTFGAQKYSPDNWQKVEQERYFAAALRHIAAYQAGESCDEETGISHLAHAQCCLHFLQWHEQQSGENNV